MNHRIPSSLAASMSPFALAILLAGGCGQAFSLTGGTSGGGGEGGDISSVDASAVTSGSGGAGAVTAAAATATSTSSGSTMSCDTSASCPADYFCMKAGCGGGDNGTCEPVSPTHVVLDPVCGCDGITYWNSLYAASSPKAVHKTGPCGVNDGPKSCNAAGNPCPGSMHCAVARAACTDVTTPGTCWVVPNECDGTTVGQHVCEAGIAGSCRNLCTLISKAQPFVVEASSCTP
jgi:hypothetical protein